MDPLKNVAVTDPKPNGMRLSVESWDEMLADVARKAPLEACGLIAGNLEQPIYQALAVISATNSLQSPISFQIDPQEQLAAFNRIEANGWELIGIYHSHPHGPDEPSPTDIAENYYPETIQLIWSKRTGVWKCRGFLIQERTTQEVSLLVA